MLCQEEKARELKLKGVSAEKRLGFPIYDADPQNTERILLADADGAASRAIRSGVWLDLIQPHDNSPSGDPPPEFLAATGPSYIWLQKPCGLCGGGHLYYAGPVAEDPMELLHQVHAVPDCRPGQKGLILHVFYDIDPDTTKRLMQDNSLTVERTINARTRTEEGGKGTCTVQ
jgi:hypothetical protein